MAKMSFSTDNKAGGQENFPKLKLDQDETARITIFEEPEVEFVHNVRKPKIVNGEVQYKTVNGKNGPERQMDFDFVTNPICLGDFNTVSERGLDVKNCPACKAAQEAPDMFQAPKRRFAMHVFQYTTNGTSKPTKNLQGSVKVWAFTDQKFGEIADLKEEAPGNDLKNVDLILGPCENKLFQKFKIIASPMAKWKEDEEQFRDIVEENRAKDLINFIGRTMKSDWMVDKLDEVRAAWRVVNGQKGETAADGIPERNLDAGLAALEGNVPANVEPVTKANNSDEVPDLNKLLEGF